MYRNTFNNNNINNIEKDVDGGNKTIIITFLLKTFKGTYSTPSVLMTHKSTLLPEPKLSVTKINISVAWLLKCHVIDLHTQWCH